MPDKSSEFQNLYAKLNVEQKLAVDTIDGPVLVLAGPGTGKTQVLTMRVANILLKTDTPADAVLALTFTESGVRAMRERLLSIIGTQAYFINIHTFHSFASDIIQTHRDEFVISTEMEPLSDLERIHIFKEIFDELDLRAIKPFNSPYFYIQTAVSRIKDLKREGIDAKEYLNHIETSDELQEKDLEKNYELLKVYELYNKKLKKYGRYDFEDMINFVVEKFRSSENLLRKYQERFQYFLVDEFQDTNSAQAELLYQISSFWDPQPNLFVVGDDDQSIYRFQGASIENILDFNKRYPHATKIALRNNYRSVQPVLDAAGKIITNNKLRISKELNLPKEQNSQIETNNKQVITYGEFSSSHTENHYIADQIKKLVASGTEPHEIAVIYRNNVDSIDIADMLSRFGIKYNLEGGENVLEAGIIIRLLHLLKAVYKVRTKSEDLDLFTLFNYEFLTDIESIDILKLSRFASNKKINFFEALDNTELKTLNLKNEQGLTDFYQNLIKWNELAANSTFIDFLETIMEESGYLNWILNQEASYEHLNKLNSFLSEVKRLNQSNKNLNLADFLRYIDLMRENNIVINEETLELKTDAVKLTTAHRSKGLEFKYVFIPKFIDKKWSNTINRELIKLPPNILKTPVHEQNEDDRRLFFVVLTRAMQEIYITSALNYQTGSYQREGSPSMFKYEIPEEFIKNLKVREYEKDAAQVLTRLLKPKEIKEDISKDEQEFLKQNLQNFKLSASSLNTYLECAYKFKVQYLLRTPQKRERPLIMGIAVHKALELAYKRLKSNEAVDVQFLKSEFSAALRDETLHPDEHAEIEKEGHALLHIYHKAYETELTGRSDNILFIEKFFGWGWSKPLLDGKIHLQGKVDKIEMLQLESAGKKSVTANAYHFASQKVRVVDYKTGRPKSRNEILGNTKYSTGDQYRQLIFYKLLLELDNTFNYEVSEVQLDFIGHRNSKPKRETFTITAAEIDELKEIIRKVAASIESLNFERTKNYSVCQTCQFRYHCWPDGIPAVSTGEQLEFKLET